MTIGVSRNKHQEKSERTRARLLDATVECLIELGYAKSSMNEICVRAGLSRGAQLHHFPTKAALMAAAVEHLVIKQASSLTAAAEAVPAGPERNAAMVDLLWAGFSGPLAKASMELWMAASTDPELRASLLPVERELGRMALGLFRDYAGVGVDNQTATTLYWLTVNLVRGLALDEMLGGDGRRRAALLASWKAIAAATLAQTA